MSNPSYRVMSEEGEMMKIAQTFDLTQPDCPGVMIDLQTMLRRFDVKSVTRTIYMSSKEADARGIGYAGG